TPTHPSPTSYPYTTLSRSYDRLCRSLFDGLVNLRCLDFLVRRRRRRRAAETVEDRLAAAENVWLGRAHAATLSPPKPSTSRTPRSEEHTSELQSPDHLVCR